MGRCVLAWPVEHMGCCSDADLHPAACAAQVMMRLKGVKHLDPRQASQLEAAFYAAKVRGHTRHSKD